MPILPAISDPVRFRIKDKGGIKVETYPQAALHFFSLNLKHDKLKNPAIWEATKYLIDYDGIANTLLKGQMKVHQTFWPEGFRAP